MINEQFYVKICTIADDCNVLVQQNLTFSKLPDDQNLKISPIHQLLDLRSNNFFVNDFNYHI